MNNKYLSGILCILAVTGCRHLDPVEQNNDSDLTDCGATDCGSKENDIGTDSEPQDSAIAVTGNDTGDELYLPDTGNETEGATANTNSAVDTEAMGSDTASDTAVSNTGSDLCTPDAGSDTAGAVTDTDSAADTEMFLPCDLASDCLGHRWYFLPQATQRVGLRINLDPAGSVLSSEFDVDNPGYSSNFSTAVTVYDSLGTTRRVDLYFRKTSFQTNEWKYYVLVDGSELTDAVDGTYCEMGSGALSFTTEGELHSEVVFVASSFNFRHATQNQLIEFDFGESIIEGGTGRYGSTGHSSFGILSQVQDGHSGSGKWSCVNNRCEPVYGVCSNGLEEPCCGDDTCNPADGKNESTCQVDCNWQCRQDEDCVGRQWEAFSHPTSDIEIHLNLEAGASSSTTWDTQNPGMTSNMGMAATVCENDGGGHIVALYFRKETVPNTWGWYGVIDGGEVFEGESGVNHVFGRGTLLFTTDGYLDRETVEMDPVIHFRDAAEAQLFSVHFGDSLFTGGMGYQTTQYAGSWDIRLLRQDGHRETGHWHCDDFHQCVPEYDTCEVPATPYRSQ